MINLKYLNLCWQTMDNRYPLILWYLELSWKTKLSPKTWDDYLENCKGLTQWTLVPFWLTLILTTVLKHQNVTKTLRYGKWFQECTYKNEVKHDCSPFIKLYVLVWTKCSNLQYFLMDSNLVVRETWCVFPEWSLERTWYTLPTQYL